MQLLAGLFLSTTAILSAAAVRDGEAEMTLIVPVPQESIASVRYAGKQVPLVRKGPAAPKRRLVVLAGGANLSSVELHAAMAKCPECFAPPDTEVWANPAGSWNVAASKFAQGWIGVLGTEPSLLVAPETVSLYAGRSFSGPADILRLIGETYAGRGPVEVYWLDNFVQWLDGRWRSQPSPVYELAEYLGDAGITVFPIISPLESNSSGDLKYAESVFGTRLLKTDGARPGETLMAAMRPLKTTYAQITCVVPAAPRRSRFQHVPPALEILDGKGQVMHKRRIAAEGMKSYFKEGMDSITQSLIRIVPQVQAKSLRVARSCPSVPAARPGSVYLWLENVEFPEPARRNRAGRRSFEVLLARADPTFAYPSEHDRKRAPEKTTRWIQMGHSACVGPLPIEHEMRLGFYQPQEKWALFLSIERP